MRPYYYFGDGAGKSTLLFEPRRPGGGQVGVDASIVGPQYSRVEIDVEGYEPLVLRGMEKLLARSPGAAIVTEVSYHHWAKFGDPAALIRQVAGDRRVFRIHLNGRIEELPDDIHHAIDQNMICYMLLLPRTDAAWAKVARFADIGREPPSSPPPSLLQAPPAKRSFGRRVAGRLMRMVFPNEP